MTSHCKHGNCRASGPCPSCHHETMKARQRKADRIAFKNRLAAIRGKGWRPMFGRLSGALHRLAASFEKSRDIHERVARVRSKIGKRVRAGMSPGRMGTIHYTPRAVIAARRELIAKTHAGGYAGYYRIPGGK